MHIKYKTENILLINPPFQDFYQTAIRQEPLGLKYIAAVLQQQGYHVTLFDTLAENKSTSIPLPKKLAYLSSYYPINDLSPFKLFTHYRHFGLTFNDFEKKIRRLHPAIIGISANFTPYFDVVLKITEICKTHFPTSFIVMGGHHVTANPYSALHTNLVDVVVLGEGEDTFLKLIEIFLKNDPRLLSSLPGIAFKQENDVIINPIQHHIENLDSLPRPAICFDKKIKMIITSRGCPKNCNFCSIEKVMGKKVRFRSIPSVMAEIEQAVNCGIHHIDFEDDTLTINKSRTRDLMQAIVNRFHGAELTLSAMNGIDADTLDEELICLMKEAGFKWLNIPLVSSEVNIQKQIDRQQSLTHFEKVIKTANSYNLKIIAYIILGLPEDRLDQMLNDIIFLAAQKVLIGPSIFYPPPGTITYDNCLAQGYIQERDFIRLRSSALPVETLYFTRNDLITLFRLVRLVNYLKYHIDNYLNKDEILKDYILTNTPDSEHLCFDHRLNLKEIGFLVLHHFFIKGQLKGLKLKMKKKDGYYYEWLDYTHSPMLVEKFLQIIKNHSIRGVSADFKFNFSN